jgi:hypothetical protein
VLVSKLPALTARRGPIAAATRSRQDRDARNRAPSAAINSQGRTTLPAASAGSRPPAMPNVMSAATPASTSARAALSAASRPMPLTANNAPSLKAANSLKGGAPPRRIEGPSARASASSAATTPTPLNDGFRDSMSDSATREISVGCQRPQGKISRIAVVAQIKHARKSGSGIARVAPQLIRSPGMQQVLDAAAHRVG